MPSITCIAESWAGGQASASGTNGMLLTIRMVNDIVREISFRMAATIASSFLVCKIYALSVTTVYDIVPYEQGGQ
jgi:hypothetical protein